MKRRAILVAVALSAIALASGAAFAYGGFGRGHGDPTRMNKFLTWKVNDLLDELDANDTQRARILAVKDRLFQQALGLKGQRQAVHSEVTAEWNSERPDVQKLRALADQQLEVMRKLSYEAIDAMVEVHGTLTPAQRTQLAAEIAAHHRR